MDYRSIAPLAAYIDRINAEQLNFRKFMVKEYRGNYYIEKSFIEINRDGTISCSNDQYAPTEDEAAAIKIALQGVSWPQYVAAPYGKLRSLQLMLAEQLGSAPVLFEFFRRSDDTIIMVQQRKDLGDGKKRYIPWTFWSDGQWRSMEPDELLPLWKPRQKTGKVKLMIHEGAKAAHFIHDLLHNPLRAEELAKHPWAEELAGFEHWGMIGGALAPKRTDWLSVKADHAIDVVYICDNDFAGKAALRQVSSFLRYTLKGVMFDERWRMSWDMADPMPPTLFTADGRWLGPQLAALMRPATWATEAIGEGKKKTVVIRREFTEEWLHSVRPEVFIHKHWPSQILTTQEFNTYMRPFSDTDDLARLLKTDAANKTAVLKYSPELPSGIYTNSEQRFINTHKPTHIKAENGDTEPWHRFMTHLVPEESDRNELLRWCATLIARPAIKMLYGVLLISETQGVGKGTLGEKILTPLMGEENVSFPSEAEIVDSNYNYWASHKRLAVIHEIYAGHSSKAYNKLKSIITDHHVTVSQKYMANYFIDNWIHIFACSNSFRALRLSMDDRRWFVPKVTDELLPADYWVELNRWLDHCGGLGIIKQWAHDWLERNAPVQRGAPAPWSVRKREMVEEGYSEGQQFIENLCVNVQATMNGQPLTFTDAELRDAIRMHLREGRETQYLESKNSIRKVAKNAGWFVGKQRIFLRGRKCRLISTSATVANTTERTALEALTVIDPMTFIRENQVL